MRKKRWLRKVVFVFFIIFLSGDKGEGGNPDVEHWPYSTQQPNWPPYVLANIWVPKQAKEVRYYTRPSNYQVSSEIVACFPAASVIDELVNHMAGKGWKRLEFDFLNPKSKVKLNHAKPYHSLAMKWGHYSTKDAMDIYQWVDDWQDLDGNIIRYGLMYRVKSDADSEMCALSVIAIYVPSETVKQIEFILGEMR